MNYLDYAANPMAEPIPTYAELRRSFFPSKSEAMIMQRKQKESALRIRKAIAKLQKQGKW